MIFEKFLKFPTSELRDSYKLDSHKKNNCVKHQFQCNDGNKNDDYGFSYT